MKIPIKKIRQHADIPKYATPGSSGFDLVALETVIIEPGQTVVVRTGLGFELPPGYELQIRPRSGVTRKTKLRVANSPGTVDADYRGEVGVIIDNIAQPSSSDLVSWVLDLNGNKLELPLPQHFTPEKTYIIVEGDRIAQGVICQVVQNVEFEVVDELSETERGGGGFGSTGTR